jgi:mono/diheme cytochrome c family protein
MTLRRILFAAATLAGIVLSLSPLVANEQTVAVHEHHLDHAVLMLLGAVAGLALYRVADARESPHWIWPAVLSPIVAMFLMAPSLYAVVDAIPSLHALNHLAFVGLAMLTTYAGQRYLRGVGWATGLMLETMAVVAAFGYGVAPALATAPASAPTPAISAAAVAHGRQLFAQNCAVCHGAQGQGGGIGPSLKNEATRKNFAQVQAWIKKPLSPMPALYPAPLNAQDVADVAAFVETLK